MVIDKLVLKDFDNKLYIELLAFLVSESPEYLDAFRIAELWAAVPGELYENKHFYLIRDELNQQIEQAIIDDKLEAIVEERVNSFDDGFKEITDKNRVRKMKDGWLGANFVKVTIHRDKFKQWLVKSNQWPLAEGCLLAKWWPQAKQVPPPMVSKTYLNRDVLFEDWIATNPGFESMTIKQIKAALAEKHPHDFNSGFTDWWKAQKIYKGKPGRKKLI